MWHKVAALLVCILVGGMVTPGSVWADGAVYAMTNALGNNKIIVYHRASDGRLTFMQQIATGGGGSGIQLDPTDSLGSQGGLVFDPIHRRLFAVNTESLAEDLRDGIDIGDCQEGTISSFHVAPNGRLQFVDKIPSGGLFPASLAVHGDLLYVLNAGGPGLNPVCGIAPNITGFKVRPNAEMRLFLDATQPLDPGSSPGSPLNCDPGGDPFPTDEFRCGLNPPAFPRSPGQIGFTPDNNALAVTVKGTNTIYVFPLDNDGRPGTPTMTQVGDPTQPTPFGFAFTRRGNPRSRQLIVTEPFGTSTTIPSVPASAVSSFALNADGDLEVISESVANGQGTSCWIALDPRHRYAYIGNNATSNISSYRIGNNGSLTLLKAVAAAKADGLPNDLAVARDGNRSFLYVLYSGTGTVGAYRINGDGSLDPLGEVGGLPIDAGAQGLAAH